MNNIDYSKYLNKIGKNEKTESKCPRYIKTLIVRTLISVIIFLITAIVIKSSNQYKNIIYENIFEKNISFTGIKKMYDKYLGGVVPLDTLITTNISTPVFNENLSYKKTEPYLDGVRLTVENNYLMPVLESGIVVYVGEKESYGNTIIIQGMDGVEIWYANLSTINASLYDYVEKGSLLGETKGENIYLVYSKNGIFLDYEKYLY